MQEIAKADIFFFITTIAVVVISVVLVIALIYAVKIMRNVRHISDLAKEEMDELVKDVKELRGHVRHGGGRLSALFSSIGFLFKKKKKRSHEK